MTAVDRPAAAGVADGRLGDVTFRGFRGPVDFQGMVEANMAARDAYGVDDTITVEGMAAHYANLSNSDVWRDLLIVELDGRVVGYTRAFWDDQHDGSRSYTWISLLRPELQAGEIAGGQLEWAERRLHEVAADHVDDGRARWLQTENWDANPAQARLLEDRRYVAVRRGFEMVRRTLDDLPDAPVPAGLAIRPVIREDFRRVWEAATEAFRDHWGEQDESEKAWRRFRDEPSYDPAMFVIAFDGDDVAGLVVNVIDDATTTRLGEVRGSLDMVAVRRPWRRRGLARALIAHSLRLLRDRGATSAMLGVDGENPNRAMTLYESCGFRVRSSETVWRKPLVRGTSAP